MNTAASLFRPALLACAAAGLAHTRDAAGQEFEPPAEKGYYFRLGPSALFGVKATITGVRPVLGAGVYDNGFVLPDNGTPTPTPPPDALTWNWGYNNQSQIQGGQMVLNRYENIPSLGEQKLNISDPLFGGELIAGVHLVEFEVFNKAARLNMELGYGFTTFSSSMDFTTAGAAGYTTAAYDLGGTVPPLPPYAGTPGGPGPLIPLTPAGLSTVNGIGTTVFHGTAESSLHQIRLGPSLDIELNGRIGLGVGFGYSSIFSDSTLRYSENSTFDNVGIPAYSSVQTIGKAKWSPGVYAEGLLTYKFTKNLSAYFGGDIAYHKNVVYGDTYHQVKLNLGRTYGLKTGIGFSF